MYTKRRDFLATTSWALAGSVLAPGLAKANVLNEGVFGLSDNRLVANAYIAESLVSIDLRTLATTAVEAAIQAGASYADIRVAETHNLTTSVMFSAVAPQATLEARFTYGVRTLYKGTWSFVHGTVPSVDAVVQAARQSVDMAKGLSAVQKKPMELASTPVVQGEWSTPMQMDPFDVPLVDQGALLSAYRAAVSRVLYASPGLGSAFIWRRENRVFASSEGTLTRQTLRRFEPGLRVEGTFIPNEWTFSLDVPRLLPASGGYEAAAIPGMQEEIKATAEEAARLAQLPRAYMDVGRYPVAMDGLTFGCCLGQTFGQALELDRVLGYEADGAGTSYLNPPADLLGTAIASPLLTITGNRFAPTLSAAKWDDEGAETREFPVMKDGHLVDYFTSRQTAPALNAWYSKHGNRVQSNGCAVATEAGSPVMIRPPQITVDPGNGASSLDEVCKDIKHGMLIRNANFLTTDHQLTSGFLRSGLMLQVENGKIVRRIRGNSIQFVTQKLLKSLVAMGDKSTIRHNICGIAKGQPWAYSEQGTSAPAVLLKDVDVVSTRRQI